MNIGLANKYFGIITEYTAKQIYQDTNEERFVSTLPKKVDIWFVLNRTSLVNMMSFQRFYVGPVFKSTFN